MDFLNENINNRLCRGESKDLMRYCKILTTTSITIKDRGMMGFVISPQSAKVSLSVLLGHMGSTVTPDKNRSISTSADIRLPVTPQLLSAGMLSPMKCRKLYTDS